MGIKELKNKKVYYITILVFILAIITFIVINVKTQFMENEMIEFNSNWLYKINNTDEKGNIELPLNRKDLLKGETVVIENKIPYANIRSPQLIIRSNLQRIKIYIDDKLIYNLEKSELQKWGKEPESQWIFVDLQEDFGGKKIKIEYTSDYKGYSGQISKIYIGDESCNILSIFAKYASEILVSILLLALGIILCGIYLGINKLDESYVSIFYLGLIDIFYFLWVCCNNKSIELYYNESAPLTEINILSLYILPILVIRFIESIISTEKSLSLKINRICFIIFIGISSFLHFTNKLHFIQTIGVFHILIGISIINIFIFIRKSRKANKEKSKLLLIASLSLLIASGIDLVLFYEVQDYRGSSFSIKVIIAFTIIYSYMLGKEFVKMYDKKRESIIYKQLAFTDVLTGLLNRLAFDERMLSINENLKANIGIYIFIFDLNNLKSVNDNLGHSIGDKYIRESAEDLKKIFEDYGEVYRIGGDEFAFIANKIVPIEKCIILLDNNFRYSYKNIQMGISYGYKSIDDNTVSVYDIYSMADDEMYKTKAIQKREVFA